MANYIEYHFKVAPIQPATEILIAELGFAGFESFVEQEDGLLAYIPKKEWRSDILEEILLLDSDEFEVSYAVKEIPQINWNESWEKNFRPIVVDNRCTVRAPFHPRSNTEYDIVIEPKMSFGTGHHETTHMMIQQLLQLDLTHTKVLDMGSGTGVLAILAEKLGATSVDAIDIDEWCYINAQENIERNHCTRITAMKGDVSLITDRSYDLVIANINRNTLLEDIPAYARTLHAQGVLLLSGFFGEDLQTITEQCITENLSFVSNLQKNEWIAAFYRKN